MRQGERVPRTIAALAAGVAALALAPSTFAATFTVTSANDADDGFCDPLGHCSLREAINAANNAAGPDIVTFVIGSPGAQTIAPQSALPAISGAVIIDGTTQPGYGGTPLIEIQGSGAGAGVNGLAASGGVTIIALGINRFTGYGIVFGTGTNALRGSYIGVDILLGTVDLGNGLSGVLVNGGTNTIGGTSAADRNVISGNTANGITVGSGVSGTTILGNSIGTIAAGGAALPNGGSGILVSGGSATLIGGTAPGAGNVISGNGTDLNNHDGIQLSGSTSGTTIQGNLIGTNAAGTVAIPNAGRGIKVDFGATNTAIGGTAAGARNVISGNGGGGVAIGTTGNAVQGNYIGTDAAGTGAIGNGGGAGVLFFFATPVPASNNTVGGTAAAAGNVIAHNAFGVFSFGGTGNAIRGNSIFDNDQLGIDLSPQGVNANDAGDGDGGANNGQNYPVLTSAQLSGGTLQIAGQLDSTPSTSFDVEIFLNPACDAAFGHGEGKTFVGRFTATTSGSGLATFSTSLSADPSAGTVVTATATDPNENTSEFSTCITASTAVPPETTIGSGPGDYVASAAATLTFSADKAGSTFECRLDGAVAPLCTSPQTYSGLGEGGHFFEVQADAAGNVDPTPAVHRWSVDTVPGTGQLDQHQGQMNTPTSLSTGGSTLGGPNDQRLAEIVTPGLTGRLTEARVAIGCLSGATTTATAEIQGTTGGAPNGTVLASASVSSIGGAPVFRRFAFASPPSVTAGTPYALVVSSLTTVSGCYVPVSPGNNPYPGAFFFRGAGDASWQPAPNDDLLFATFVDSGTIIVNSSADPGDGACTPGDCTLREAINAANSLPGVQTIGFSIGGSGQQTIRPTSALPTITEGVLINGTTQPGWIGPPLIEVDGTLTGGAVGLAVSGGGTTIRALAVTGFSNGLDLSGNGNVVEGSYVGLRPDGTHALGNTNIGVLVRSGTGVRIGGSIPTERNVVSGNFNGIIVGGSSSPGPVSATIEGNYVGTSADGGSPVPNTANGILVNSGGSTVGGTVPGSRNRIAFNNGAGVFVAGGTGTSIRGNAIYANGALGIDLAPAGVTANDAGDADSGPNDLQNFPTLTDATIGGGTITITGDMPGQPTTSYELEFFASDACDPSGNGEGRVFLGSATVTTDATGTASFAASFPAPTVENVITATATGPDGSTSELSACLTPTTPPTVTGATVSIDGPASSLAGAASAAISGIPVDAIRGASSGPSATPLGGIPLGGIPLGGIPLGGIPLGGIPLGGIPLGGIGFTAADLNQNGLGGVPLSTIPLKSPDSWEARLDSVAAFKGSPPNNVTLAQVLGTPVVSGVTLSQLDLSASPLGGIPLGGIALGSLPLGGIPLGGIAGWTTDPTSAAYQQNLTDWCSYINAQPGYSCPNGGSLAGQSIIGLALQGVPLGGIPLGGIPLGGIPLGGIPLGGIAVGTPLGGIPLGGIDLTGTPLGGIPLGGIDMTQSPLGGIPLGGIPVSAKNAILTCPTGTFLCADADTLAQATAAGAIKADAKLQDLGYYKDANGNDITLKDLVKGLPPGTTLEDLIATILSKAAYDWEGLPLTLFPLQDFSSDGGKITYTVAFSVAGTGTGTVPATIGVHLPPAARYDAQSAAVSGSASVSVGTPSLIAAENELTFPVTNVALNTPHTLTFKARPGLTLGSASATAKLAAGALPTQQAPAAATTQITQTLEPNDDPATAPIIQADTLYVGYTPNGSDRDFFRIAAPAAGTQRIVHLSHLNVDDDLVVYGQAPAPLRDPQAGSVPTGGQSVLDIPFELQQRTQAVPPEPLTDVPQNALGGASVLGVSDNRGFEDEEVALNTPEDVGGYQTIQISSFDGGYSNEAWVLRVEDIPAVPMPASCAQPSGPGGGSPHSMPAVPATASTLYLINSQRLGDLYGSVAEGDVWTKLQALAGRADAAGGAVIPLESNGAVATAYSSWTANGTSYCSPGKANDVVRAIGKLLDQIVTPSVEYVVIVGDDTVVPYGRVLDNTSFANERGYVTTFIGSLKRNQYMTAYGLGFLPTDDPYGDVNYTGTGPYVPELATGRLVEKPAEITAQIDQYIQKSGAIAPANALVTGYDFLKDGATRISTAHKSKLGAANVTELINDTWSKADLISAMFPTSGPVPQIDSINAHYDHYRSLPADENAANRETILYTTADVAARGPSAVNGRVIYTLGCHSALAVSDFVVADALKPDWAQVYAAGGALVYMGNTGYGLGDTVAVAYSERLNALFAERLDGSMTVGQALAFAKQEYSAIPTLSGYDLKVLDQATMYGLPMLRLGTGAAPTAPLPAQTTTDASTGLASTSFSVSPSFTKVTTSLGSYYTVNGDAVFENRYPVEPFTILDVTQPNLVAHGAVVSAATSTQEDSFDVVFSRVVDDLSSLSPELVGDVSFPTKLQAIGTLATPLGTRQRLMLFAGQFRSSGLSSAGIGTQRRFTALAGNVLFAPATAKDFRPASFGPVQVTKAGATVGFAVDVTDLDENGNAGTVKRVFALYKDGTDGTWKTAEFSQVGNRWSGAGPLSSNSVEWFIQAVDASGNVGVTSNKALVESVTPPVPTGSIAAHPSGAQTNGWYTESVSVTIDGAPGISYSVDGSPFTPGSSLTVSGTGVHSLDFQGSDGSHGTLAIPIDVTDPVVSVNSSYVFGAVAQPVCSDAGSGIATCTAPQLDTGSTGAKTVHVHAEDRVGRSFDGDLPYMVTAYPFDGFFAPVNNGVLNTVKAGSSVPVKFSLKGYRGGAASIFAANSPGSTPVACGALPTEPVEQVDTEGSGGLSYNPLTDRYTYVWKTDKTWQAGTCRRLVVAFKDGTSHTADFQFK